MPRGHGQFLEHCHPEAADALLFELRHQQDHASLLPDSKTASLLQSAISQAEQGRPLPKRGHHKKSHSLSTGGLHSLEPVPRPLKKADAVVDALVASVSQLYNGLADLLDLHAAPASRRLARMVPFSQEMSAREKLKGLLASLAQISRSIFEPDKLREFIERAKRQEKQESDAHSRMQRTIKRLEASILGAHSQLDRMVPTVERCSNIDSELRDMVCQASQLESNAKGLVIEKQHLSSIN